LATNCEVAAIGEIGLDYYYDNSPRDVQRAVFEAQTEWAERAKKPVLVHLRNAPTRGDAYGEAMAIIANHSKLSGGVIHCFSGGVDDARRALDLGFYISFAGPITYPKSSELREAAAYVPTDCILCETDSPYLPPQSKRGRRNEPALVREVYEKVAQARGVSLNEFSVSVWENCERLFGAGKKNGGTYRLSVHKLVEDYGAKEKCKTLIATVILVVAPVVMCLAMIPKLQYAVIRFIDPAEKGWVISTVKFVMYFAPFSIFILSLKYRNAIEVKQHIDEMRIYVTGIGFVDRKKGKETFANYSVIKLSYGETRESFLIESDAASIKLTEYRWPEFTHSDVLRNNLEEYGDWADMNPTSG
jgi:TatD DNase family protein